MLRRQPFEAADPEGTYGEESLNSWHIPRVAYSNIAASTNMVALRQSNYKTYL